MKKWFVRIAVVLVPLAGAIAFAIPASAAAIDYVALGDSYAYIDGIAQFIGHGACGNSPWLHTLSLTEGVMAAHPNLNGDQLGYLPLLNAVIG